MREQPLRADRYEARLVYKWQQDRRLLFGGSAAVLLLIGAFASRLELGYYTFERSYIALVAMVLAYCEEKRQRPAVALIAVGVAILFNPLIPVRLVRTTWFPADLAAAAGFAWIALEGFSKSHRRSILAYCPAFLILAAALIPRLDFSRAGDGTNTMNVDTSLTVESLSRNSLELGPVEGDPFADIPRTGVVNSQSATPPPSLAADNANEVAVNEDGNTGNATSNGAIPK